MDDSPLDRARQALRSWAERLRRDPAREPAADALPPPPDVEAAQTIVVFAADDPLDVMELLDAAVERDVVLLVPRDAAGLREPLAWPHLATEVRRLGLRVLVVGARRDVRAAAAAAGFPVVARLRGDRRRVQLGERSITLPSLAAGRWMRGGLGVGLPLVVLVAAWCTVPEAEIVIAPRSTTVAATAEVRVNPIAEAPDSARGVLPASPVRRTIRTVASTVTTGTTEVGDARATVELLFTNDGAAPRALPAGLEVSDENGTAFALDAPLTVAPGETAAAGATAVRPGPAGNVEAGALRLLPAGTAAGLSVENPAAAAGGTAREVPAVDGADVDRVRGIATDVLRAVAERELRDAVDEGDLFLAETIAVAILAERPLSHPGDPARVFLMEYEAVVSALVVPRSALAGFAEEALAAVAGEAQMLLPGTATATLPAETRETVNGVVSGVLTMEGEAAAAVDLDGLRGAVTGMTPGAAAGRIAERVDLAAPAQVTLAPGWWPRWRLPSRAAQIAIRLAGAAATGDDASSDTDSESDSGDGGSAVDPAAGDGAGAGDAEAAP